MKLSTKIRRVLDGDPVLKPILDQPYNRPVRSPRGLFGDLVSAIISQQVSTAAARTIHGRLQQRFQDGVITADGLIEMTEEEIRACGLSRQKCQYVRNIGQHFLDGGLNENDYHEMSDEEIIKDLTSIKGVGVWTVHMILMSTFQREDVFPVGDLGIQNVMKDLYNLDSKGRQLHRDMEAIAEAWRPYRTYACLYMWNTLH